MMLISVTLCFLIGKGPMGSLYLDQEDAQNWVRDSGVKTITYIYIHD